RKTSSCHCLTKTGKSSPGTSSIEAETQIGEKTSIQPCHVEIECDILGLKATKHEYRWIEVETFVAKRSDRSYTYRGGRCRDRTPGVKREITEIQVVDLATEARDKVLTIVSRRARICRGLRNCRKGDRKGDGR